MSADLLIVKGFHKMSMNFVTAIHRHLAITPGIADQKAAELAAYREMIDRTPDRWIAEVMSWVPDFDVSAFGSGTDFDDDFHAGDPDALEVFVSSPVGLAAARDRLWETAREFAVDEWCRWRSDVVVGGMWVAVYGGLSCGDEPFVGFDAVRALAGLPELGVSEVPRVLQGFLDQVFCEIEDDEGLGPVVAGWVRSNRWLLRGLVEVELGVRESVIVDAVAGVLSEVRLAVLARVGELVG